MNYLAILFYFINQNANIYNILILIS